MKKKNVKDLKLTLCKKTISNLALNIKGGVESGSCGAQSGCVNCGASTGRFCNKSEVNSDCCSDKPELTC